MPSTNALSAFKISNCKNCTPPAGAATINRSRTFCASEPNVAVGSSPYSPNTFVNEVDSSDVLISRRALFPAPPLSRAREKTSGEFSGTITPRSSTRRLLLPIFTNAATGSGGEVPSGDRAPKAKPELPITFSNTTLDAVPGVLLSERPAGQTTGPTPRDGIRRAVTV